MVKNNVSAVYHYQLSIFYFSFHKLIKKSKNTPNICPDNPAFFNFGYRI